MQVHCHAGWAKAKLPFVLLLVDKKTAPTLLKQNQGQSGKKAKIYK